jgi:hypothetical protein
VRVDERDAVPRPDIIKSHALKQGGFAHAAGPVDVEVPPRSSVDSCICRLAAGCSPMVVIPRRQLEARASGRSLPRTAPTVGRQGLCTRNCP